MHNIGEEITGEYLKVFKNCGFITYNLYTPDIQGEIDVVGINIEDRIIYICEVAIHLATGVQYNKNGQPDNVDRFIKKFRKDIEYANKYFTDYEKHFMLWSPVVRNSGDTAKHNQMNDVLAVQKQLADEYGYVLDLVINEKYYACLKELRDYAKKETKELKSPVLRLMQIEEVLKKRLARLPAEKADAQ